MWEMHADESFSWSPACMIEKPILRCQDPVTLGSLTYQDIVPPTGQGRVRKRCSLRPRALVQNVCEESAQVHTGGQCQSLDTDPPETCDERRERWFEREISRCQKRRMREGQSHKAQDMQCTKWLLGRQDGSSSYQTRCHEQVDDGGHAHRHKTFLDHRGVVATPMLRAWFSS